MAYFRITPGTEIKVTPSKAQFEIGEDIWVNVVYHLDGKELTFGGWYTCYCDVHIFGKKFTSDGDQKYNEWGTTESEIAELNVHLGKATSAGTFDGYVVPKAHIGI